MNKVEHQIDACKHLFAFIQRWRCIWGCVTYAPGDLTKAQDKAVLELLTALQKVEELALAAKDTLEEN